MDGGKKLDLESIRFRELRRMGQELATVNEKARVSSTEKATIETYHPSNS